MASVAPLIWECFVDMADPPACSHSKSEVVEAGKILGGRPEPFAKETQDAFRLAHAWRSSHVHPMRRVRFDLARQAKKIGLRGVSVARLKRMHSIRKKLSRGNRTLYQIQDIGGCRIILPSMDDARRLLDHFMAGEGKRPVAKLDDYIDRPKRDGYRSFHAMFKFNGPQDDQTYGRHVIEAQIRTELQHAWATAVEAVGLFQNEDMKGGEGDPSWRRLFALTSAEFAAMEGGGCVPDVPEDRKERFRELRGLVQTLDALRTLDGIREAISYSERVYAPDARFFLIEYDYAKRRVEILPQATLPSGIDLYESTERWDSTNSVLVEVDRLSDLIHAYPNYFLDVGVFTEKLRAIVSHGGKDPPSKSGWRPDLSWLRDWRGR
jgi:hypothetical protein